MPHKQQPMEQSSNNFGKLVRAYREQRNWSQEQLAEKWGYTREYVSLIERGKRKLDRIDQINHLADILEIPSEQLDAIGRGIPQRKPEAQSLQVADEVLLQTLLEPALATVKFSWLVWFADSDTTIIDNLTQLITKLENATTKYRGSLLKPAQQVLAYAHEMKGKLAFDQLDYITANGHFQEMLELGEVVHDPNIIALSMIHQGDLLRKRGRYEYAVRRLEAAQPFADAADICTRGIRWQILARTHAEYGYESLFQEAIDKALETVTQTQADLNTLCNQFNLVEVLQEQGQGYTLLWKPEKALEIYQETEQLKPFRPLRDLGSFTIIKAQAHAYNKNIDEGVKLALNGLELAKGYRSKRHVARVQNMYDRLSVTPLGKHPRLRDLKEALMLA